MYLPNQSRPSLRGARRRPRRGAGPLYPGIRLLNEEEAGEDASEDWDESEEVEDGSEE